MRKWMIETKVRIETKERMIETEMRLSEAEEEENTAGGLAKY